MICIKSLHKYFNKGRQNEIHVINDVNLELPDRGMVAVFGKSGCGKTTLLNVIGGLDGFSGGEVSIDGQSINSRPDDIRNKYMGYIFQNYNLSKDETCFENVADALRLCGFTDREQIEKRVMAALKNVDMDKYKLRTPDTLSGGQQQRIAIARAIVKNPRIILADEPTGNLDEANTLAIMELLRQIAKEHLVILVTHEANLVDYYCDTVIELSDGKVVGEKHNDAAAGYSSRNKNDIFLGELDKSELSNVSAEIEYYGEKPQTPVKLKIVNSGGKVYLRVDTPKVQIIDSASEVRLREGVFKHEEHGNEIGKNIDMTDLPPVEGTKCGRMFSFGSAVKSGYRMNFKKGKKGKKFLRFCLGFFAALFVLVSAFFGTAFNDILKVNGQYNHNVFYVYTPNGDVSDALIKSVNDPGSGIDYVRLNGAGMPFGDVYVNFHTGFFETFYSGAMSDFGSNAVPMDSAGCSGLESVAGKNKDLDRYEIVITTAVADKLTELSAVGFIKERKDLLGLTTSGSLMAHGNTFRIAGIVKSSEPAVYLSESAMAEYVLESLPENIYRASDSGLKVPDGSAVIVARGKSETPIPSAGDTTNVHGKAFRVDEVISGRLSYTVWLSKKGYKLCDLDEYIRDSIDKKVTEDHPGLGEQSELYYQYYDEYMNEKYFEVCDGYFEQFDEYLNYVYLTEFYTEVWLAVKKNVAAARYVAMSAHAGVYDADVLYYASLVKAETGNYPAYNDACDEAYGSNLVAIDYNKALEKYNNELKGEYYYTPDGCYLSDADYIAVSKCNGATDAFLSNYPSQFEYRYYTLVHSSDPQKTEMYLKNGFSYLETGYYGEQAIRTPDDVRADLMKNKRADITQNIISLAVILALMSVCMYFIMRSSFMIRIKEVGIYRAIGASKRNLVFKFLVEAAVLILLTVFIGYLLMSVVIACFGSSALMATILYYPVWLALCVFVVLTGVSLVCGIIPVLMLLRKSPSAILAKYDI